jgi:hypothetical protein
MRRLIASAAVAVFLAGAAGSAAAAPTASKAEFIRRGDALCVRVARQLAPLVQRAQAAQSLPESKRWAAAADIWGDQIRIQARFNRQLRAIGAPRGDARARRILRDLDRGLVMARRVRSAFVARDQDALVAVLPGYLKFTAAVNRRVGAYGFRYCGRS